MKKRNMYNCIVLPLLFAAAALLFSCGESAQNGEVTRVDAPIITQESTQSTTESDSTNGTGLPETETDKPDTTSIEAEPDEDDNISSLVDQIYERLTLEEKIGQLILVRKPADKATALEYIGSYHPGGYVLFASDFENETPETISAFIDSLNETSSLPLFYAVDEEGGTVVRISKFPQYRTEKFLSPRELIEGGADAVTADTDEKCRLLMSLGINFNLAPVADISEDSSEFIYYRSAGGLDNAVEYVRAYVEKSSELSVGSTLKHFPGYGGNADTHTGAAYDDRGLDELMARDLVPFIEGIEAGADAVMVSHNTIECLDHDNPASLSPAVHELLRDELGFDGIIITDDLAMGAVCDRYDSSEAAVMSILAGNDLVCCSDLPAAYQGLYEAALDGRLTEERIAESVKRIIKCKLKLGIIDINTEER